MTHGGTKLKKIWSEEEDNILRENYPDNGAQYCEEILLNKLKKQIARRASRLGLKVTKERNFKQQSEKSKLGWKLNQDRFNVNHQWFMSPFSPESSYLLGYIWADGYINNKSQSHSIRLEILSEDFLEISSLFDLSGRWHKNDRMRKGRRRQTICSCNNFYLYNYLKKFGYENKSIESPNLLASEIPKKFIHYWLRGYSDGDGCFYVNKKNSLYQYSLAGSYEQNWDSVSNILKENDIEHYVEKRTQGTEKKTKSSVIRINGKHKVSKFGDYIYQGRQFGLMRKFNKYQLIKNKLQI